MLTYGGGELTNLVQTGLVIDATENDGWSPEQVTEDELNAVPLAGDLLV